MKKLFNTLMFLALGSAATYADNTLRIADFVINAGEQKTLEIELNNDDNALSSLQFDIALPKGLTYVDGSVVKATDRITRTSHTVKVVAQKDGDYRFGIFSNEAQGKAQVAIAGKSGAILSITVKAEEDCEGGKITFNEITGSDATVAGKVEKVAVKGVDGKASVSAGELAVTSTKNLFLAGKKVVVDFNVKNDVKLSGMSAIVTLPEGVTFAEGDKVVYGKRLSENVVADVAAVEGKTNTYKLTLSSFTNDVFAEGDALFGLNLVAGEGFKGGDLVLSEVKFANPKGIEFLVENAFAYKLNATLVGAEKWIITDAYEVISVMKGKKENPNADLTEDGKVDLRDVYSVIKLMK